MTSMNEHMEPDPLDAMSEQEQEQLIINVSEARAKLMSLIHSHRTEHEKFVMRKINELENNAICEKAIKAVISTLTVTEGRYLLSLLGARVE